MAAASIKPTIETEYSLFDYVAILRRRWIWLLLPVILTTALVGFLAFRQPDRYVASARVLLADTAAQRTLDPSSQNPWYLTRELSNEITLARSDLVEQLVEDRLGIVPSITIEFEDTADVLIFAAESTEPNRAAEVAGVWAETYVQVKQEEAVASVATAAERLQTRLEEIRLERQELRKPIDDLEDRLAGAATPEDRDRLQVQLDRLTADLSYELNLLSTQAGAVTTNLTDLELQAELAAVGEARIVAAALPPSQRSNPPLSRNLALGVITGLMLGAVLALIREFRDNTIKSSADVTGSIPVLASIPRAPKGYLDQLDRVAAIDPKGIYADGYQKLRAAVEFMSQTDGVKSILVTSPNAGDGKSTTASNLAIALSSVARRTVLVDTDFRRGRLHEIFDLPVVPGLSDYLVYQLDLKQVAHAIGPKSGLFTIPAGSPPPNPAAFIGNPEYRNTINWLGSNADNIVLDAPPLLAVSDVYTLAQYADAVILTVMAGKTTKSQLAEVVAILEQIGAKILGVVLVGVKNVESGNSEYYTSVNDNPGKRRSRRGKSLFDDRQSMDEGSGHNGHAPRPARVPVGRRP